MIVRIFRSKLDAEFEAFLVRNGYPLQSILYEQAIPGSEERIYRPDFIIIDPINFDRLAVIEVRNKADVDLIKVTEQLKSYRKAFSDLALPAFLVCSTDVENSEAPFDVLTIGEGDRLDKIDLQLFPKFQALVANKVASRKKEIRDKEIGAITSFEKLSSVAAALLVILVIADFLCALFSIELLTVERLSLIGGAVALLLVPYANKIKGLGIEWERVVSRREE